MREELIMLRFMLSKRDLWISHAFACFSSTERTVNF